MLAVKPILFGHKCLNGTFFFLFIFFLYPLYSQSQSTTYSPLFTNSTFDRSINTSKPVGSTGGSASVTMNGSSVYSIPIYAPPGSNALQPSISLNYNSLIQDGVAGVGWSLSGLSAITRNGKNLYNDPVVSPVSFTNEDRFYLDGSQLLVISGENGGNGSVYGSESETFSKIISNTTANNDPDWFLVISKDGTLFEFGRTTDARFLANNSNSVMMWRLNKVVDINGNYIEYKYLNSDRDSRIDEINYTGNSITGQLPYNKLKFSYTVRSDETINFNGGASTSNKYLLDKIVVTHNYTGTPEVVKTYRLNYGYDNTSSFLKEFLEGDGTVTPNTFNSTIFQYGDKPLGIKVQTTTSLIGGFDFFSGDFDADGKSDLLAATLYYTDGIKYHSKYELQSNFSESSSTVMYSTNLPTKNSVKNEYNNFYNFLSNDYSGDGRDDILLAKTEIESIDNAFKIASVNINITGSLNSSTGYTNFNTINYALPAAPTAGQYYQYTKHDRFLIPGDFDGDGNHDYILVASTLPSRPSGSRPGTAYNYSYKAFFTNPKTAVFNKEIVNFGITIPGIRDFGTRSPGSLVDAKLLLPADFDGDGKQEILVVKDQLAHVLVINKNTDGSMKAILRDTLTTITKDSKVFPGDFNGDRKTDLLVRNANGSWTIMFSNGISFNPVPFSFNQTVKLNDTYSDDKVIVADFNGDGKTDILHGFNYFQGGVASTARFSMYYSQKSTPTSASFFYEQYQYNQLLANSELVTGDFNGDGRTDLLNRYHVNSPADFISFNEFGKERLLIKITDGYNNTTSFDYKLLTDRVNPIYNRATSLDNTSNSNPYNYVQLPLYVVSSHSVPDGIGGNSVTTFAYEDAVVHRWGKGLLGFKKVSSKNASSGTTTLTENNFNTQFAALYNIKSRTTLTSNNELLSESVPYILFTNLPVGNQKRYFQKLDRIVNFDNLSGAATETINTYDNFGNITKSVTNSGALSGTSVAAIETKTTDIQYATINSPVPARPTKVTDTQIRSGRSSQSVVTDITYTSVGLVSTQKVFSGLSKAVTTTYTYNYFGNPTTIVQSAANEAARTTNLTYEPKNRFVIKKQWMGDANPSESYVIDGKWGAVVSKTSSDCLTTTFEYDSFGRLKKTNLPQGYSVSASMVWDIQGNNLYYSLVDFPGGSPDIKTWFDKLGRKTKEQTLGFNNQWLTKVTTYNAKGLTASQTNEYYSSESPITTNFGYDVYNRLQAASNPMSSTSYSYTKITGGQQKITTNTAGVTTSKTLDASGKIISSTDNGGQLDFGYDSWGNQTSVKHGGNFVVSIVTDAYGRQYSLTDKNAGTITYEYDAWGQLKKQIDNLGNIYTMTYDQLGRVTSRTGAGSSPDGLTTFEYYKAANGCSNNNLTRVTGGNGVKKEYVYDNYGRTISEKLTVSGTAYTTAFSYDQFDNLIKTVYPSSVEVHKTYDISGNLMTVTGGNAGSLKPIFTATAMNGFGQYINYTLGNGKASSHTYTNGFPTRYNTPGVQDLKMAYDYAKGNLLSRTDAIKGMTENFEYDNLSRLVSNKVNNTLQVATGFDGSGSFSMGNITTKTDAGKYVYKSDKIHAVAYITNPSGAQTPPANISVLPQQITYTSFLKAATIKEGEQSDAANYRNLQFTYGPNQERVTSSYTKSGYTESKLYFGNYERLTVNGVLSEMYYIGGGEGLCAIIVKQNNVNNFYFVYKDHLGSILTATNVAGTIVAQQNFDAWGRHRNPSNWLQYINTIQAGTGTPAWLYRGYTGHEHLPQFALINMNGRMYDPMQGRVLSPDNYVRFPWETQAYNRYSYAMNNPLSYTDPDGQWVHIVIGAAAGGLINLGMKAFQGKIHNFGDGLKAFGVGAVAGGVGAATGGAALSASGLTGGVFGGAISGVGGAAAASPILGGGNALAFGDPYSMKDYGRDLLIGGITGGVIGGISSAIPGDRNVWTNKNLGVGESPWKFPRISFSSSKTSVTVAPSQHGGYIDDFVEEDFVTLYHKGELKNGLSPYRSLSTSFDKNSASMLQRTGKLWEFRIPKSQFLQWKAQNAIELWTDLDFVTGVINQEVRFPAKLASELSKYIVKP